MKEGAQGSSAMESPTSSTEAERKTILVCWARTRDLRTSRVVVPGARCQVPGARCLYPPPEHGAGEEGGQAAAQGPHRPHQAGLGAAHGAGQGQAQVRLQ